MDGNKNAVGNHGKRKTGAINTNKFNEAVKNQIAKNSVFMIRQLLIIEV